MRGPVRTDPAVQRARAVVGLYGDPTITWSILLEADVAAPVDLGRLAAAVDGLTGPGSVLGRPPQVRRFPAGERDAVRVRLADTAYGDRDPLLRVAVDDAATTLLLAAHHGAVDGLGLVAVLNALLGGDLTSGARGVSGASPAGSFARRAVQRLDEAVRRPPARFHAAVAPGMGQAGAPGDRLACADVSGRDLSTAALVAATGQAVHRWNGPGDRRPVVVAVGASRRPPGVSPSADRDTAYLRVELPSDPTPAGVATLLARTLPEPAFPETRALGIGALLTRALASRLGATALVSNLGRLSGEHPPVRLAFWPAAAGPAAVAVGLATVGATSTLTLRARRTAFDDAAAQRLLALVRDGLAAR